MATYICRGGIRRWGGQVDAEGHRTYTMTFRVTADSTDGPYNVLNTPGLPVVGEPWLVQNDADLWAWCRPETSLRQVEPDGEPTTQWDVEKQFSTRPIKRCFDQGVTNPLLQPPHISGNFNRHMEEGIFDRFGNPILNSAWEFIRGPNNEWDANRLVIKITQNVVTLGLDLLALLNNTVNAYPLWGLPPRTIKLTVGPWSVNYYGTCFSYFQRNLEFEIRAEGWDRDILDEATKVLSGHWDPKNDSLWHLDLIGGADPDPKNPNHFIRYQDRNGNLSRCILDGNGQPFVPQLNDIVNDCTGCNPNTAKKAVASPGIWNFTGISGPLTINYDQNVGACAWVGTDLTNDLAIELNYDNNTQTFSLYYGNATYSLALAQWTCGGPNVLIPVGTPDPGYPATVTLSAGTIPYITTCAPCSKTTTVSLGGTSSSPKYWKLSGFNDTLILTHQSGCLWSGTDTFNAVWTLERDDSIGMWTLTNDQDNSTWIIEVDSWQCLGPNVMDNVIGGADDPDTVTLTSGASPGVRHVEKYYESDFLILGIPVLFNQ